MSIEEYAEHILSYFNSIDKKHYGIHIPSIPLLYLGNYKAYNESPLKVVTVDTNPSKKEFPNHSPFCRFQEANKLFYKETIEKEDVPTYLNAINNYFNYNSSEWYENFEPILNGMNASYYPNQQSTVLHTFMCSPLTTIEPWSKYEKTISPMFVHEVAHTGLSVWMRLLDILAPDVVLTSLGDNYRNWFYPEQNLEWVKFKVFDKTKNGREKSRPYKVHCVVAKQGTGKKCLIVLGDRNILPFMVSGSQKTMLGEKIYIIIKGRVPKPRHVTEEQAAPEKTSEPVIQ